MDDVSERYQLKTAVIGQDPYKIDDLSTDPYDFPNITYGDIVNYLVFERSSYTLDEFKSYKSLESYNFFLCGWVKNIGVKTINNYCVVRGQVFHSQRLNEKPLDVWLIAKPDGSICSAHYTCVAGLSETCSHVGALLFTVEDKILHLEDRTVTGVKAYWKVPTKKPGEPSRSKDIDFTSVKKLRKETLKGKGKSIKRPEFVDIPEASNDEVVASLNILWENQQSSVLHTIVQPFAEDIERSQDQISNKLSSLFEEKNLTMDLHNLIKAGEKVDFQLSSNECKEIEMLTRKQAKSSAWFKFRIGRITASNFRACLFTKIDNPSISLLKQVCYTTKKIFKTAATTHGCDHEKVALNNFKDYFNKPFGNHTEKPVFQDVGFVINPKFPEVGASPDGLVECACCGPATIEIKCPFCARNMTVEEATSLKNFCLTKDKRLDKNHKFFYQCQMQMAVTERKLCYFVVWTKEDLSVDVVKFDEQFWETNYEKAKIFHKNVIMPELLGKFFSRKKRQLEDDKPSTSREIQELKSDNRPSTSRETQQLESDNRPSTSRETQQLESDIRPSTSRETQQLESDIRLSTSKEPTYCSCNQPENGRSMIACDNFDCPVEWYHLDCVGIDVNQIPSKWYCDLCK